MRAAVFHGQKDIRVEDVEEPTVQPGMVKVAVEWCGICGTDLHEYLEGPIFIPPAGSPHPLTGKGLPVVIGHEFAGEVVEVGDGVDADRVGQKVAVEPLIVCGTCPECSRGDYHLCRQLGFFGLSGAGGGFAEFCVVPDERTFPLRDLSTEHGALVEPMAVSLHAVRRGGFGPGQTALVLGAGPIGLMTVTCLRASGARAVIVSEVAGARKDMARQAGADVVVDPTQEDVVERVLALTGGAGVDVAFDAAGVEEALRTGMQAVRRGGTFVNIAIWGHAVEFNPNDVVLPEVSYAGTICYNDDYPPTIAMMNDGRIQAGQFITKRIGLEDIVSGGFEDLIAHKDQHAKILVQPT